MPRTSARRDPSCRAVAACRVWQVLEAHGGCFAKLSGLAPPRRELRGYTYRAGGVNADFEPGGPWGAPSLTPYNARSTPAAAADGADGAPPPRCSAAEQLKPYANTCGWRAIRAGKCAAGLAGAHYEAWPNPQTLSHSTTQTL